MRYAFADCLLDTDRRELQRAGRPVRLRARAMQVLTYLIEHSDRVVPKEELFATLWAGRIVGDATLNSCLKEVRRAVGDRGDSQAIIRTLHAQGYRFVAPLSTSTTAAATPPPASTPATATPSATEAQSERKQVSILACVLADAHTRASALGAEAMDDAMHAFFTTSRAIVERYGGRISEWRGDGFTALFGAPFALEDHARCAVLAALELRARDTPPLRIGLHAGEIVVGNLGAREQPYTALGHTTELAARICAVAPASVVAVSEACFRLVETEVVATPLDANAGEAALWAIESMALRRGGVPQRARRAQACFVGRTQELAIVRTRLELAAGGIGQVVCVSGDPGIGKSRVLAEVRAALAERARLLQANCLPYRQATPYFTLARLLRDACGIADDATPQEATDALAAVARRAGIDVESDQRLLLELLDVCAAARSEFEPGSSCSRVFALANRLLVQASREQTCIVVIEDLHWMDATSSGWLEGFVRQLPGAALLLLVTFRPSCHPEWVAHSAVTRLALPRLSDADSTELVASMIGARVVSDAVRRRIVNHAQGNPFFLEELTWSLLEGADDSGVPTTIQAVLAARIDQLAAADKVLLQTAAVIDTPVPHELLREASALSAEEIVTSLNRLEAAELLYPVDGASGLELHFKHALTQNVAYGSLLGSTRRELHRRIAEIYERACGPLAAIHPELVARHYTEAGVSERALHYWKLAGQRAAQRSANQEAILHFQRALDVAPDLADEAQQQRERLELRLLMGPPLMASKAFSSQDVEVTYHEACALAQAVGNQQSLFVAQWGLWLHCAHRGQVKEARSLSTSLLSLAETLGDPDYALQAHHAMWTTDLWDGDLAQSHAHARAGIALYDKRRHHAQTHTFGGHDPGVCALGTAGITAWFLGAADEALHLAQRGADLASQLAHPYSRLVTRFDFMLIGWLRREVDVVREAAQEALSICTRLGVPDYLAVTRIFLGWVQVMSGRSGEGFALLDEGLAGCREIGAERNLGSYLLLLADACFELELAQRGLAAVEEAGRLVARAGESRWAAEILRVHGELSLLDGAERPSVEAQFVRALGIARAQGARALELRAATSLARMRTRNEARAILEPIYRSFTEGLDTADLRAARAVLG